MERDPSAGFPSRRSRRDREPVLKGPMPSFKSSVSSAVFVVICVVVASCSARRDGPGPNISSVAPPIVCTAQAPTTITITGTGFSPAVRDALTDHASVLMPQIFLTAGGVETQVPASGVSLPAGSTAGTQLAAVIPANLVGPGTAGNPDVSYDVHVVNPNGNEDVLANALLVVPPPDLLSVAPVAGPRGTTVTVTLTGAGFRPGMSVRLESTPPVNGTSLVIVSPTSARVDFDLANVPLGTYAITVTNPEGCLDTLPAAFTVTEPTTITITGIDPPFGCTCEATSVTISSVGGFVSTPMVELRRTGMPASTRFPLTRVAFVSIDTLTAVVPPGLALGSYDVIVTNPPSNGGVGTLVAGFRVVALPVPRIVAVVPNSGTTQAPQPVVIYGASFRTPVTVQLIDMTNTVVFSQPTITPTDAAHISVTFPSNTLGVGAYLVRVIDEDEATYSTFSNFIVKSNSGNPALFVASSPLTTGRRLLAGVTADDDLGNHYLYAIGGDTGVGTAALATVEVSQLSKFGDLAAWKPLTNQLTSPRVGAAAVTVPVLNPAITDPVLAPLRPLKTFIYVLGGKNAVGTVLSSIERAVVLASRDAPINVAATANVAGTLAAGTWYYKVAAVLPGTDPDNPGGETLASDEAIVSFNGGGVTVTWGAPASGVAVASYRIYRTEAANDASQQEVLIAANVTGTSFVDTGSAVLVPKQSFLPSGSTGVWMLQTSMMTAGRWGHSAVLATDDTTESVAPDRLIYVAGGLLMNGTITASVEYGPLDGDGVTPAQRGQFGAMTTTGAAPMIYRRAFFSMLVETSSNVSGYTPTTSRLWAISGLGGPATDASIATLSSIERAQVTTNGGNSAWFEIARTSSTAAGTMSLITNNKVFVLGGASTATATPTFSGILGTGRDTRFDAAGDITNSVNSVSGVIANPRALGAIVQQSGFYYLFGGTSDGANALTTSEHSF